jgi:pimeloyl-ACP methyl ester carboxylesterase
MRNASSRDMAAGSVLCLGAGGFHRMTYVAWGDGEAARNVICVHGLTRNGRDFDDLASKLAETRRVVCPDVVGRGRSDWLSDPSQYQITQYVSDLAALIARMDVGWVDWVGTSMGGLIGMVLAAQANSPIRRLVLNDVGPFIAKAALERIAEYCGKAPHFDDVGGLELYLREVHAPFGPLSDQQWRHLATHGGRVEDGELALAYDPGIAVPFTAAGALADTDLWSIWDAIRCPVLVLRGESSDLLSAETVAEMAARGPKATVVEIKGCGHAPALMAEDQIAIIDDWLES